MFIIGLIVGYVVIGKMVISMFERMAGTVGGAS